MVNENHSYGKAIRYDPTFHTSIGFLTDAIQKANEARIATFSRDGIGLVVMATTAIITTNCLKVCSTSYLM